VANNPATFYGTDFAVAPNANGILDIQPTLQYVSGLQVLIQSLICRQMCVKGSISDAPNEGIDLRTFIRAGLTQQLLAQIPSIVEKELLRDQRVQSATVTGNYDPVQNVLTLNEVIQSTLGPFSLTLAVSALTVTLIDGSP
jgi:hypothetical protein